MWFQVSVCFVDLVILVNGRIFVFFCCDILEGEKEQGIRQRVNVWREL